MLSEMCRGPVGSVDRSQGRGSGKFDYTSNRTQGQVRAPDIQDKTKSASNVRNNRSAGIGGGGGGISVGIGATSKVESVMATTAGTVGLAQPKDLNWEEFKKVYKHKLDYDGSKEMMEYRKQLDKDREAVRGALFDERSFRFLSFS